MIRIVILILAMNFIGPETVYCAVSRGFSWVDNVTRERIELFYNNRSGHQMCFDSSNWPNASGNIALTNISVTLLVDGHRYDMSRDEEYCPGCEVKIPARSTISAFIAYSKFTLPKEAYGKRKNLEFTPIAYKC